MKQTETMWKGLILAMLFVTLMPGLASAVDVTEMLGRMRSAAEPGFNMRARIAFTMTNDQGESVVWTGEYWRRSGVDGATRVLFESPADIRGIDISVHRVGGGIDRSRVYSPFVRRVREIHQSRRGQSVFGTDFNYEELGLEELEFQQHAVVRKGTVQGRPCYWVESVPDSSCGYGKVERCLDEKDYLPRETRYYHGDDLLFKVRTLDRIERIGKYMTPTMLTMRTVPFNTSTRIEFSNIEYDTDLSDSVFEGP